MILVLAAGVFLYCTVPLAKTIFEDITESSGIVYKGLTQGAAWDDFDNDGLPDLFVTNHHYAPAVLYRNMGNGKFKDVTSGYFDANYLTGDNNAAAWADFNNDGKSDIFVSRGAGMGVGSDSNSLFVNLGTKFEDRAQGLGVDNPFARGRMPLWYDFNRDGLLDLFQGADARFDKRTPPFVFLQENEKFIESWQVMKFRSSSVPFCIVTELTNDNISELICRVAGPKEKIKKPVQVFSTETLPFPELDIMPESDFNDIAAGDFTGDGRIDLYLARRVPQGAKGSSNGRCPDRLLINYGDGILKEEGSKRGINRPLTASVNVVAGDFDNDMDLDIYIVNSGHATNHENTLLLNRGNGYFDVVKYAGGAPGSKSGLGDCVAAADFDMDGFLDLLVADGEGEPDSEGEKGGYKLYRNIGNENHWIQIDLEGTASNRDGVGAVIYLTAGGKTQIRIQDGGVHNRGQNHERLHFGLGKNTLIDSIKIYWPSGTVQELNNISADQLLHIKELATGE